MRYLDSLSVRHSLKAVQDLFYGWKLVGVATALLTLMALVVFQGMGTLMVGLERQFNWSRFAMSGAFALARAEGAILGPLEGFIIDRFGARRMILIGYVTMGVGYVLMSQIDTLWQFYATFMIITLGSGLGGWLAIISVVNNWFIRKRSLAIATAMSGIQFGAFLVPVLAIGIESHGFRVTSLGVGLFLLAIVVPVTRAIRNTPEEYGLRPDGEPPPSEATAPEAGGTRPEDEEQEFTAREALKTPVFWLLSLTQLTSSVSITTLALHLSPRLTDMGMPLTAAGTITTLYAAIALPTQFASGYAGTRLPKPQLIAFFYLLQAVAMALIAVATTVPVVILFAVLFGMGFGGRIPLTTAIRGDYFGRKAFATIMGMSQFASNIAMMGAPLFAGYWFDTRGSYFFPFITFAVLSLIGSVLMLFVRKPKAVRTSTARRSRPDA